MKIYLSGPITGIESYKQNFDHALRETKQIFPNAEVMSPPVFCEEAGLDRWSTWEEFMDECIKVLKDCTHIVMLPGWKESRGACVEYYLAQAYGLGMI